MVGFNGVDIASRCRERHVNALLTRMLKQLLEQKVRAFGPFGLNDGGKSIHPLAGFLGIGVAADVKGHCANVGLGLCVHACLLWSLLLLYL